jgi:tetratricopeptide (TPR) repeat protein
MKTISTHSFKYTLRDVHKHTENRKFCFIIGAGSSRKSGIPTGGELAQKWFSEIKERLDKTEFSDWLKEQKIDEKDLAASYGSIYRKRFENDKTSGYEFLVQAMKSAKPSFGHIVLAQILSRTAGHCVLTTNFDSLVESSVYQFTNKTPLVCGHESLSGYARPSQTHPLIIKIHRDLLMAPKSDPDEINKLDPGWKEPLDHIFSTHIPVVVGYGGNDGSLMSYFEEMNKPSNFFWCGLDEKGISERIKKLIEKHDGNFVKINGFDELMHDLLWVFDEIKPIKDELNEITNERIAIATKQLNEINSSQTIVIKENSKVETKKELSALEYSNLAEKEQDLEVRKQIYLEALDKYPTTGWLWWNFTYFLHFIKKEYENLEGYYEAALKYNKSEAGLIENYALFLNEIKRNYTQAEEYFLKALSIDPNDADSNNNYALFLKDIKRENTKAEEYFLKTLEISPHSADYNGNYASFLYASKKDHAKAEEYFLKALSIAPNHSNNNINYAIFLEEIKSEFVKSEECYLKALNAAPDNLVFMVIYARFLGFSKKDFIKAEECFLKALAIDPNNVKVITNYANFLKEIKKDYLNAEIFYLKANSIDQEDAINNCNYALFLKEKVKNYAKAEEFFLKALASNPEEAGYNCSYAGYLKDIKKDYIKAEFYYKKAYEIAPNEASIINNYATSYLKEIKKDIDKALECMKFALSIDPHNCHLNGNYAQLLLIKGDKIEAEPYLQRAFEAIKETNLMLEVWFYRYAHYPEQMKNAEIKIEELLLNGAASVGWNFDENIKQAIKEKHPNPKKLKEFAERISAE